MFDSSENSEGSEKPETPLHLLLEGLSINRVLDRCVALKTEASAWLSEEIEEPENVIEKFLLEHGINTRKRLVNWPSAEMELAAREVREAYDKLTEIEEEFEHLRRILFDWDNDSGYENYLPKTRYEYVVELREIEDKIYLQAEAVEVSFQEFEKVKSRVLDPTSLLENLENSEDSEEA